MGFIYICQIYLMLFLLTNVNYFIRFVLSGFCVLCDLLVFLSYDVSLVVGE